MKNNGLTLLAVAIASLGLQSCEAIGAIFKTGMGVGIFVTVLVIVLIAVFISRSRRKQ